MNSAKQSQPEKFQETARSLEADDSEENFDRTLKRIVAVKPLPRNVNPKEPAK